MITACTLTAMTALTSLATPWRSELLDLRFPTRGYVSCTRWQRIYSLQSRNRGLPVCNIDELIFWALLLILARSHKIGHDCFIKILSKSSVA
jgi:hypothetical protein